jgi:hypothetical protein
MAARAAAAWRRIETELSFDARMRAVETLYERLLADRSSATRSINAVA